MPHKKLAILIAVAIVIPILGYFLNRYEYVHTFPFGTFYHSAITYGTYISGLLFLVGFLGLFAGLLRPQFSLWVGDKNRTRAVAIYGLVLVLGGLVKYETYYLSKIIFSNEEKKMALAYEILQVGIRAKEIELAVRKVDKNIGYHYADTSPYREISGYPYDGTPRLAIEFKYPSFYPKLEVQSRIVVEISADPRRPEAVAERMALLSGSVLRRLKPTSTESEAKIYKGFLVIAPEVQTFTPCGSQIPFWLDLPNSQRDDLVKQYREVIEKPNERSYAVLSGLAGPKPDHLFSVNYQGSLKILKILRQNRGDKYRCEH